MLNEHSIKKNVYICTRKMKTYHLTLICPYRFRPAMWRALAKLCKMAKKAIRAHVPFWNTWGFAWDNEKAKWWFSVLDIIGVLNNEDSYTETHSYWKYLTTKLKIERTAKWLVSLTNWNYRLPMARYLKKISQSTPKAKSNLPPYGSYQRMESFFTEQ